MVSTTTHHWRARIFALAAIVLAAFVVSGSTSSACAQSQLLLTEQHVTGFIASYPEIVALSEEFQGQDATSGDDLAASLGAMMTYQNAVGRLDATVAAHGFANYGEWMQAVGAITTAYLYASEGGAMDAQMEAAIAGIQANPNLNDDQKQMMLQQMEAATASMSASKPSQENIDLVNAHADELETIFNEG